VIAAPVAAAVLWLTPLSFGLHNPGWYTGLSGTVYTTVGRRHARIPMSTAWASNVRYHDRATSDPPNYTLQHFPASGVVVWGAIQTGGWPPGGRRISVHYSLADPYRFPAAKRPTSAAVSGSCTGLGQDVLIASSFASTGDPLQRRE
jgi:hypothetical protein